MGSGEHGEGRSSESSGSTASSEAGTVVDLAQVRAEPWPQPPELLARGATLGRYVVLDRIGRGGMGAVYAAYDPELDRKVALKMVQPRRTRAQPQPAQQTRLLREAQALAQVSHPNVVAIHDVGSVGGQVFLAMELVEGETLRKWLETRPPSSEVLKVFVAAGRGLAAVHAAGLVHRDFKPDNVIIRRDGRVCIMDFGVVRAIERAATDERDLAAEPDLAPASEDEDASPIPYRDALVTPLTQAGAVVGSPPYMSPEQFRGHAVDARADQFSFCVALYEALNGQHPFERHPAGEADRWTLHPPRERRAPARVQRALVRGLSESPEARHPSMDALLAELLQVGRARWGKLVLAVALLLIAGFEAAAALRGRRAEQLGICGGASAADQLASVWNPSRKLALERAFLATGRSYAAEAWTRTARVLDDFASRWASVRAEACAAGLGVGGRSNSPLSLRMVCLERRRQELGALTDLLAQPDDQILEQSISAAHALTPVEQCLEVDAMHAPAPLPLDPVARKRSEQFGYALVRSKSLLDAGKYADGLKLVEPVAREAGPLGDRSLEAEALELKGSLQNKLGDLPAAEKTLMRAVWAGEASSQQVVVARASSTLVSVLYSQAKGELARQWSEPAVAALAGLKHDPSTEATVHMAIGGLLISEAKPLEAIEPLRRALALREKYLGLDHPDVGATESMLASAYRIAEQYDMAVPHARRALAIRERSLGARHPETARALFNMGVLFAELGRVSEALDYQRRALAAREAALGPQHPSTGRSWDELGVLQMELGRYQEALAAFGRADAVLSHGPRSSAVLSAWVNGHTGMALVRVGKPVEGLKLEQRALAVIEQVTPQDDHGAILLIEVARSLEALGRHAEALGFLQRALASSRRDRRESLAMQAAAREALGRWHLEGGHPEAALAELGQALALREHYLGRDNPGLAEALLGLGQAQLAQRAPTAAVAPLERALALLEHAGACAPERLSDTRFALARALWESGGDQRRAFALAGQARDSYPQSSNQRHLQEMATWLRKHPLAER